MQEGGGELEIAAPNPHLRCVPALRRSWSNSRPSTRMRSAR
jgi:hypothetical protein